MTLNNVQWNRCIGLTKSNAPSFPNTQQTRVEQGRSAAGRAAGLMETFLDELDIELPGAAGNLLTIATTNSVSDYIDGAVDSAASDAVGAFGGAAAGSPPAV